METLIKNDVTYWNEVANKSHDIHANTSHENFGKKKQIIKFLLDYNFHKQRVLEIGPGNGFIAYMMRIMNRGMKYKGIDVSDQFAKAARTFYKLDVQQGRITELPFEDNSFTVFFAFDVMEHIHPDEREEAYLELKRVLDIPNSMVFINNPLSDSQHDEEFDYYFTDQDVARMAEVLNMRIGKLKVIGSQGYYYQIIQLIPVFFKK